MTKLDKYFYIITTILFLLLSTTSYSQKYSVDDKNYMKSQRNKQPKPSREERYVNRKEKKRTKQDIKKKRKKEKQYKRMVKKYNKEVSGGGTDVVTNKKTYFRMKKNKRLAKNKYKN